MRELLIIGGITVVTLVLWFFIGVQLNDHKIENQKTLETPPDINGTIDVEFLEKISNN